MVIHKDQIFYTDFNQKLSKSRGKIHCKWWETPWFFLYMKMLLIIFACFFSRIWELRCQSFHFASHNFNLDVGSQRKTRSKCIGFNQPTRQKANVCYFTYLNKWSTSCWNVFSIKFNSEITWWANNFHLQIIHQVKIEFSTKNISENQVLPLNWTLQNFNVTVSRATWNMYTQKVFSFSPTFQKEQIIYCLLSQSKIKGVTRGIAVFMNSK